MIVPADYQKRDQLPKDSSRHIIVFRHKDERFLRIRILVKPKCLKSKKGEGEIHLSAIIIIEQHHLFENNEKNGQIGFLGFVEPLSVRMLRGGKETPPDESEGEIVKAFHRVLRRDV